MTIAPRFSLVLCFASLIILSGCDQGEPTPPAPNSTDAVSISSDDVETKEDVEFVLGDLIPEFNPPTQEELAETEWTDKPVVDVYQLMADRKESEVAMMTAAEALAIRNNTPEENDKIVSAMGTLAADGEIDYSAEWNRHTAGDIRSTNPLMIS